MHISCTTAFCQSQFFNDRFRLRCSHRQPVKHDRLRRFTLPGMLLATPLASPGQIVTNRRSHEESGARVRQQPAGLLQQFVVRCQRRLIEEAAVHNAAARVVTRARKFYHISPVLRELYWLPVRHRITYK